MTGGGWLGVYFWVGSGVRSREGMMTEAMDLSRPTFVSYIERTRAHYLAQGYGNPYRYAFHREVPFARLPKPLAAVRLGVVTTAMPLDAASGETPRPKRVFAAPMDPRPERLFTEDLAWAKESTHMEDMESYLPIGRLGAWVSAGRVGELASRFYGLPTEHTQQHTREVDAPAILELCRVDGVEAVLLAPIWPTCHQSVGLTARHLESNGIATVVLGSARDVIEHCGVPRFLFTDFPLGNSVGRPYDAAMQQAVVGEALDLLESAVAPRTTVQSSQVWGEDGWREAFLAMGEEDREALLTAGEAGRRQREADKASGRIR